MCVGVCVSLYLTLYLTLSLSLSLYIYMFYTHENVCNYTSSWGLPYTHTRVNRECFLADVSVGLFRGPLGLILDVRGVCWVTLGDMLDYFGRSKVDA